MTPENKPETTSDAQSELDAWFENVKKGNVPPAPEKEKKKPVKPTTSEVVSNIGKSFSGANQNVISDILSSPMGAGAALGAGLGAYRSGASFNPFSKQFLQYNPRTYEAGVVPHKSYVEGMKAVQDVEQAMTPKIDIVSTKPGEVAGMSSLEREQTQHGLTRGIAAKEAAELEKLNAIRRAQGLPPLSHLPDVAKLGPTVFERGLFKPLSAKLQEAYEATKQAAKAEAAKVAGLTSKVGELTSKYLPGVENAGKWVKGALPTLGSVVKGAGALGSAADVAGRLYSEDKTGAGVSAVGALAPLMLAPQVGIPISIGSMGINYLRDNPEIQQKLLDYVMTNPFDVAEQPSSQEIEKYKQMGAYHGIR